MSDPSTAMEEVGVHESIQDVIERVATQRSLVVYEGASKTPYVGFMPSEDTQIAFFANRTILDFALDPDQAKAAAAALGLKVAKQENATAYLRFPVKRLEEPGAVKAAVEIGLQALERNSTRRGRVVGDRAARDDYGLGNKCAECNLRLPVTGICDDHG